MKLKHLLTLSLLTALTLCQPVVITNDELHEKVVMEKPTEPVVEEPIIEPKLVVQEELSNTKEVMLEVSYYCSCEICCDVETGITASGAVVQEGRTVAMPSSVPFGAKVYIEELDHTFVVEDRGGYIKQLDDDTMRVDVYVDSHELALQLGRHMSRGIIYYDEV